MKEIERLSEFVNLLKERPLENPLNQVQWDQLVDQAELTKNDMEKLAAMRDEHLVRAKRLAARALFDEAADEWSAALQLFPANLDTTKSVMDALELVKHQTDKVSRLKKRVLLRRRELDKAVHGKKSKIFMVKWIALTIGLLAVIGTLSETLKFFFQDLGDDTSSQNRRSSMRNLLFTLDTGGVKVGAENVSCQFLSFPETDFIETKAWISFPENQITYWTVESLILDATKRTLAKENIILHSQYDPPLEVGQGVGFFQQVKAQDWAGQAMEVFLRTISLKAKGVEQVNKKGVLLNGQLPQGFALDVFLLGSSWKYLFDRSINRLHLEVQNSGLRPINELRLNLVWKDASGNEILKTKALRAVSAYRIALPSGGKLPLEVLGEFPIEIFSWLPNEEPQVSVMLGNVQ